MPATDAQVAYIMWNYASYAAAKLSMVRREDIDNLWEGQLVLVATPNGMNVGRIKVEYGETEDYQFAKYLLNEQLLYEHHTGKTDDWKEHPKFISHLPEKVVVYVAY